MVQGDARLVLQGVALGGLGLAGVDLEGQGLLGCDELEEEGQPAPEAPDDVLPQEALRLGVDDGGNLIGLGPDYATLKQPDADRFELWLRGMWRTRMGTNAAALPQVDFAPTPDGTAEVCRVTAPPSPLPVYLRPAKGRDGAALGVRVCNSTRRLEVDDAVDYVMLRWPRINHVAWPIRLGNFLLRRDQSRRALPINPAAAVTAATGSRDDEGAGQ